MNFAGALRSLFTSHGDEHTLDWHRTNGTHHVRYPDGAMSQPFSYKVTCDYAKIFGGEVIPK